MGNPSDPRFQPWRRHALGGLSLLMFAAALGLWLWGGDAASTETMMSLCLRVGLLLGALWLALPQVLVIVARFPLWMIIGTLVMGLLVLVNPRLLAYAIPLMGLLLVFHVLGWFTRPLADAKKRDNSSSSSSSGRAPPANTPNPPPANPPPVNPPNSNPPNSNPPNSNPPNSNPPHRRLLELPR
jgi:hypothetical protein